jgi:hypothetical protein
MLIVTILLLLTSFFGETVFGRKIGFYLDTVVFAVFTIIGVRFFIILQTQLKLELIKKSDNSTT